MAVVFETIWSDGESKSKVPGQTMPVTAKWSDGESKIYIAYGFIPAWAMNSNIILIPGVYTC